MALVPDKMMNKSIKSMIDFSEKQERHLNYSLPNEEELKIFGNIKQVQNVIQSFDTENYTQKTIKYKIKNGRNESLRFGYDPTQKDEDKNGEVFGVSVDSHLRLNGRIKA